MEEQIKAAFPDKKAERLDIDSIKDRKELDKGAHFPHAVIEFFSLFLPS